MYILLSMSVSQKDDQKQKRRKVRKSEGEGAISKRGCLLYSHPYSAIPDEKVTQYLADYLLLFAPKNFQAFHRPLEEDGD